MAANHQRISRLELDLSKIESGLDLRTWRGNETVFHLGLFNSGSEVDASGVESVNCKVRASRLSADVLADKTVVIDDANLTKVAWESGDAVSAELVFSNAEMNLDLGCREVAEFYVVFTALSEGGGEQTLGAGRLRILEDNNGAGDLPAENPGTVLTLEQADERYVQGADVLEEYGDPAADFVRIFEIGLN